VGLTLHSERMATKVASDQARTMTEAADAGMTTYEHHEEVKRYMNRIYPNGLENSKLPDDMVAEISSRLTRNGDDVQPLRLENPTTARRPQNSSSANATPPAVRSSKRIATEIIDNLRYSPKAARITAEMSEAQRTSSLKARKYEQEEIRELTALDNELRRIYEKLTSEIELTSKGSITRRDNGFGLQLYWYNWHTRVYRMSERDYSATYEKMTDSSHDKAPEDILIRLDRFAISFDVAGKTITDVDKLRLLHDAIHEQFGADALAYVRTLPRIWNLKESNYVGNRFEMIREAIVKNVQDGQPWPSATKLRVMKPVEAELIEMKAQLLAMQASKQGGGGAAKKKWEQNGVRRSPSDQDPKSMWDNEKPCAYHTSMKAGKPRGKSSHTNAACFLRIPGETGYDKEHDEAVKRHLRK
jgi:hypothetical protein